MMKRSIEIFVSRRRFLKHVPLTGSPEKKRETSIAI